MGFNIFLLENERLIHHLIVLSPSSFADVPLMKKWHDQNSYTLTHEYSLQKPYTWLDIYLNKNCV